MQGLAGDLACNRWRPAGCALRSPRAVESGRLGRWHPCSAAHAPTRSPSRKFGEHEAVGALVKLGLGI
eukprot:1307172-Pleurochrysis_carterae.AAC.1